MTSISLKVLAVIAIAAPFAACGVDSPKKSSSDLADADISSREEMTVSTTVINDTGEPIEVVFTNNGPHGGGCDDKNYVVKHAAPASTSTLSETWYCKMDQWFYVQVNHPKGNFKVKAMTAKVRCTDNGCTRAD